MHFCTGYCEIFNGSTVKVFKKYFLNHLKIIMAVTYILRDKN